MTTAVLVPVKHAHRAKHRLSTVLSPDERAGLAGAMFEDVCSALRRAALTVAVVTDYEPAADMARRFGWKLLWETRQVSESHSIDAASVQLAAEGFTAVLRLPADVPLIQPEDVDEIHAALQGSHAAVAVPSWDGTGTNAILRSPPDLFPSHFGPNSFNLHREEAARVGATFTVVANDRLALDLDEACDLDRFLRLSSHTRTRDLLVKIAWGERMAQGGQEPLHSGH